MIRRIAVIAIILLASSHAFADSRAEAILLFEQGSKEMKAGNHAKACESFKQSLKLYADSGTKGSLARCYEKLGKLASSWLLWRELADTAGGADLRKDAAKQAARLDPKVGKYVIKAAETPGLVVTINGEPSAVTGLAVPIDAGKVIVVATAPDFVEWKAELAATDGATLTVDVPALVKIEKPIDQPPPPPPVTKKSKRKLIGMIVGGVGIAAIGGGAVFGLQARGKYDDANTTCGGSVDNCLVDRVAAAQAQVDDARSAANLSSIMFAAGGAMIVTGAVLYFTAPKTEQRVAITATANGFLVSGRF